MNEIKEIIKNNVVKRRKEMGYTQKDLAEKAGISTTYIGEVETCRKHPSLKTLIKISQVLNVEPYVLLLDTEKHKNDIILRYNETLKTEFSALVKRLEGFQ